MFENHVKHIEEIEMGLNAEVFEENNISTRFSSVLSCEDL